MHVTYLRDDYFTLVNQTERITIFTLYLAVENKMLKKASFFYKGNIGIMWLNNPPPLQVARKEKIKLPTYSRRRSICIDEKTIAFDFHSFDIYLFGYKVQINCSQVAIC